uniref:Uncharacterized protein n=1 Tax=Cucumis sativus TaxID=3659 RepID=A0A0A0KJR9_CUCSA
MEEEIITQIKMSSVGRGTEGNSRLRIESEGERRKKKMKKMKKKKKKRRRRRGEKIGKSGDWEWWGGENEIGESILDKEKERGGVCALGDSAMVVGAATAHVKPRIATTPKGIFVTY